MARVSIKNKVEPRVMLHGRVLYRNRDGKIDDVTHQNHWGLKKFAEDGALTIDILDRCRQRLDLLFMAAEHRPQVDASLVRLAVEDIRNDFEQDGELSGYIHLTQEMFEYSEALPPQPTPDTQITGDFLTIVKPAS